jgi:adenylyl- and sulfurtransferase ThiI
MAANASSGGYVFAALTAGFDSPASQVYGAGRGVTVDEVLRQWDWLEARQAEQKARQTKQPERKPAPKPKAQKAPAPTPAPANYNAAQVLRKLLGSK